MLSHFWKEKQKNLEPSFVSLIQGFYGADDRDWTDDLILTKATQEILKAAWQAAFEDLKSALAHFWHTNIFW